MIRYYLNEIQRPSPLLDFLFNPPYSQLVNYVYFYKK